MLAWIGRGKVSEAESLAREEMSTCHLQHGPEHPHTVKVTKILTRLLREQGKGMAALPLLRALHGNRHPRTMHAISALVGELHAEGRTAEAEPLAREAVELSASLLGESHPFALVVRSQLTAVLKTKACSVQDEPRSSKYTSAAYSGQPL